MQAPVSPTPHAALTVRDPPRSPRPPRGPPPEQGQPICEKRVDWMFWLTLMPAIRSPYRAVRWLVPALVNAILGPATFCMLYYPAYYPTQGIVWSTDMAIIWLTYNVLLYLQSKWDRAACFEHKEVRPWVHHISYAFYWLYLLYWFYFAVIQFSTHNTPSVVIQLGNTLMSTAWYFFFSTTAVVYYYVCIKLSQRTEALKEWIQEMRRTTYSMEGFYLTYNINHRRASVFGKNWNFIIFLGIVLLAFHIPIDLVSIMYNKYYYDIFGLVIKTLSLCWYLLRICELNDCEAHLIAHLYKYRVYSQEVIKEIEMYMGYKTLGLDFYGLKVNRGVIVKGILLVLNVLLPTLYALASNEYFRVSSSSSLSAGSVMTNTTVR